MAKSDKRKKLFKLLKVALEAAPKWLRKAFERAAAIKQCIKSGQALFGLKSPKKKPVYEVVEAIWHLRRAWKTRVRVEPILTYPNGPQYPVYELQLSLC